MNIQFELPEVYLLNQGLLDILEHKYQICMYCLLQHVLQNNLDSLNKDPFEFENYNLNILQRDLLYMQLKKNYSDHLLNCSVHISLF